MKTNFAFQKAYKNLNKNQKKAVDEIEGPVLVIAGPGTGKTTILTLRIANILLKTDTTADCILALTFTDSGVHSMRQKLLEIIGAEAYKVNIYTFHGFCNDVIKNYPEEFPLIMGSVHLSDTDQIRIMRNIFDDLDLPAIKHFGDPYYYLKSALSHIKDLKREVVSPEEYSDFVKNSEKEFNSLPDLYHEKGKFKGVMKGKYVTEEKKIKRNKDLAKIYKAYQGELKKLKLYDYEDMIVETVRALSKKKEFLLELQEKYQYILADEHQDANGAQNKLLELLSNFHDNPNLFIVGDEKQAIYRFQGASVGNFLYFKNLYPSALVINLEKNYRSNQSILDASHSLIEKNIFAPGFEPIKLKSESVHKTEKISVIQLKDGEAERAFIISDIKKKIKDGESPSEIAVLFRKNKYANDLKQAFEKSKIPFVVSTETNLLNDGDVQVLRRIFEISADLSKEDKLAEVLFIDFINLPNLDVYKILKARERKTFGLFEILKSEKKMEECGVENRKAFSDFYLKLLRWNKLTKNQGLVSVFEMIVRESGMLDAVVSNNNSVYRLGILRDFLDEAKRLEESNKNARLSDFLDHLNVLEEHDIAVGGKSNISLSGKVRLMTAHKSKGLEFNYVYIVGTNDGVWGNNRDRSDFSLPIKNKNEEYEAIEDERRLFYVALTRARKKVFVSYLKENNDGKELLPSEFIGEIDSKHMENISLEDSNNESDANVFSQSFDSGLDLKNREYLTELFFEEGLNPSALNNYIECPWKYFFNNLVRIPSAQDKWLLYGTAIHSALEYFFKQYKEEKKVGKNELLKSFENSLIKAPLSAGDFKEALKKGEKALSGYYDFYKGSWERNCLVEFKVSGVILPVEINGKKTDIPLRGKIDKIEILSGDDVNVVDYKTGKQKTRNEIEGSTKNSDGNYKRQLVFYKLLLDNYGATHLRNNGFRMVSAEIDFIEPSEKGKYKKEKFIIAENEVEELKDLIGKVAEEILSFSFWNKTCGNENCEYCSLRSCLLRQH